VNRKSAFAESEACNPHRETSANALGAGGFEPMAWWRGTAAQEGNALTRRNASPADENRLLVDAALRGAEMVQSY
jgi:hypothetical protein